ncbi:MAG TPA: NAD(P)/FAD-dependent oxidoreductase [Desulfobacteraceae bacterium]|nr:NAD(P)/FAD-dependent oxidoreductase [Desulfobacteraceae bacterium]HPJ66319.1 NAD(P)/FAD-dependent oxidoreductase [Desulfobacteraceae bacterium]HPQ28420.1 NAD(P)/FAD-dependent oxidoreductase [Desulfobacteraceae bacterium]
MTTKIDIAVIGSGVVGCSVAYELSTRHADIFVFEKNPGVTRGENQSSRNSGVIHSGIYYDQETRPEKASLCVEGNALLYEFCLKYKVPAIKTGKLIVATNREEEEILEIYLRRAHQNSVPRVKIISGTKVQELEPNVRAISALLVPTTGIIEPTSLVYRLYTLASNNGTEFIAGTEVIGLEKNNNSIQITLRYPDGKIDIIESKIVINASGIDADLIARLFDPRAPYELDPVRGESYKFYGHKRPDLSLKGMNVYPTPESVITPHGRHFTVGIHITPTFGELSYPPVLDSTVTVGPRLVPVKNRKAWSGIPSDPGIFSRRVQSFFPGLKKNDLIWHQAGLQARLKGFPDFIIKADSRCPNFINLLGIDSPGLTSCLSIAGRVKKMVDNLKVLRL